VLLRIVDDAVRRLRVVEAGHQRVADVVDPMQTDELSVDDSKSGLQINRLQVSLDRLIHRNLDMIHKCRRNEADGWGKTRQERGRRKQGGGRRDQGGHRLVVDANGSVRNAEGYDGNLEEGLARYEAEFGRRAVASTEGPGALAAAEVRAVPDYARWVAAAVDVVEPEPGFESGAVGAEPNEAEPLLLVEQGDRANIQNEIPGVEQPDAEGLMETLNTEAGEESTVFRRDDHVERVAGGEPRTRLSRREKKRRRREMERKELDRWPGGTKMDIASVEAMIDSIRRIFPTSAEVPRDHRPRLP
jgi:hypothetical protein